ncbi:acetyltransferase, GNAT family protein [Pedobacter sp. BAL39]|uniref:GNAT family N-acetyltransferase n=1 Tax=Pedobacter sp. BAL39 TaxID=391596 RepID=UPI0001559745|nr:GNAT family N-acetyltransferase [Pedobacter sp. BAL39]EDM36208.1 acetyltransferase, GNAT family protein [Pedobacter sp. BAL39]
MDIIKYTPAFRARCIVIFKSNQPKFFAEEELQLFADFLDHDIDDNYYLIQEEGEVVGCGGIFLDQQSDEVGLSWGMVHADFHKKGIGKALTLFRLDVMKHQFPDRTYKVDTSQFTAGFYKGLGFDTIAIVPNGFAKGLDKYVMKMTPPKDMP